MTTIQDNVVTPVAVVAQHASHKAKPIRVLTNVNLGEREQLLDLGFSVQAMDTASVAAFARLDEPARAQERLTCGKLVLQNLRGFWNGADLDLTVGEYRIIELLASRPGQHFTYRAMHDRLRHQSFISRTGPNGYWANVRSGIKRIRSKFRAFDPQLSALSDIRCGPEARDFDGSSALVLAGDPELAHRERCVGSQRPRLIDLDL